MDDMGDMGENGRRDEMDENEYRWMKIDDVREDINEEKKTFLSGIAWIP